MCSEPRCCDPARNPKLCAGTGLQQGALLRTGGLLSHAAVTGTLGWSFFGSGCFRASAGEVILCLSAKHYADLH